MTVSYTHLKFDFYRNIVPEKAPGKIVQVVHAGFHAGRLV